MSRVKLLAAVAAAIVGFSGIIIAPVSHAAGGSGYRTITQIGCHLVDNTCYVYVDGPAIGPAGCSGGSLRWDSVASPGGQRAVAQLTAAYAAGKVVNFFVPDTCYQGAPTFVYYEIAG